MRHLACVPFALLLGACTASLPSSLSFGERNYVSRAPTTPVEVLPVTRANNTPVPQSTVGVLALSESAGRV